MEKQGACSFWHLKCSSSSSRGIASGRAQVTHISFTSWPPSEGPSTHRQGLLGEPGWPHLLSLFSLLLSSCFQLTQAPVWLPPGIPGSLELATAVTYASVEVQRLTYFTRSELTAPQRFTWLCESKCTYRINQILWHSGSDTNIMDWHLARTKAIVWEGCAISKIPANGREREHEWEIHT